MAEFKSGDSADEVVVGLDKNKRVRRRPMKQNEPEITLEDLIEHFVVVLGNGMIWDDKRGRLMRPDHVRLAAGSKMFNIWIDHPDRRMVDMDDVVFEPGKDVDGINLFSGLNIKPDSGMQREVYQPLLDHLYHLCGQQDELYWWVLRWCAYPLQHVGAKMQTSIIMHGAEGTGKNLWWESIADIYGLYGVIISQSEIESDFNGWASSKMFCIADEVISRAELRHMKGKLKSMITGSQIMINQKGQPQRPETNHMNLVFLSNEEQPLVLDQGDRRYAVIRCDDVKDNDWYVNIGKAKDDGAVRGLYHYLLTLEMEGFNRHSKPPVSQARVDLIDISKPSAERFVERWLSGRIPLPVQSCASIDLYRAYKLWCRQEGERMPATKTRFGRVVGKHVRKARMTLHLDKMDGETDASMRKVTIYLPETTSDEHPGKQANQFRYAVGEWSNELKKVYI